MEYQIVCVVKSQQGAITDVGLNDGHIYSIYTIINWMREQHTFFTYRDNHKASVHARQNSLTGSVFLTTSPDSVWENNLDFLPHCIRP